MGPHLDGQSDTGFGSGTLERCVGFTSELTDKFPNDVFLRTIPQIHAGVGAKRTRQSQFRVDDVWETEQSLFRTMYTLLSRLSIIIDYPLE